MINAAEPQLIAGHGISIGPGGGLSLSLTHPIDITPDTLPVSLDNAFRLPTYDSIPFGPGIHITMPEVIRSSKYNRKCEFCNATIAKGSSFYFEYEHYNADSGIIELIGNGERHIYCPTCYEVIESSDLNGYDNSDRYERIKSVIVAKLTDNESVFAASKLPESHQAVMKTAHQ